jgi:hypothetical protein
LRLALAALALLLCFQAYGGSSDPYRDAGSAAFAFLKVDVGAAVASLGGTGSVNGDGTSAFHNPAGLAALQASRFTAGHNSWFGSTSQSFVAGAFRSSGLNWSLATRLLHAGGLERREEASSDPIGTYDSNEMSFHAAAAIRLGRFDLGLAAKLMRQKIWLESCSGFAFDAGVIYRPFRFIDLAAVAQHIGPAVTMTDQAYRLPYTWRLGARAYFGLPLGTASLSGEVRKHVDSRPRGGVGLEYSPRRWADVRLGATMGSESQTFTGGLGLAAGSWTLDYAYVPGDYQLGSTHRFTLSKSF